MMKVAGITCGLVAVLLVGGGPVYGQSWEDCYDCAKKTPCHPYCGVEAHCCNCCTEKSCQRYREEGWTVYDEDLSPCWVITDNTGSQDCRGDRCGEDGTDPGWDPFWEYGDYEDTDECSLWGLCPASCARCD